MAQFIDDEAATVPDADGASPAADGAAPISDEAGPVRSNTKTDRWMFTCNSPPADWDARKLWDPAAMLYMTGQKEVGAADEREHVHLYIVWRTRKLFSQVRRWAGRVFPTGHTPHIDPVRGTETEARDYVTKAQGRIDGPWEFGAYDATRGSRVNQGHRSDLDAVCAAVMKGDSAVQIASAYPNSWIKFHSGIQSLMMVTVPPPSPIRNVRVVTLWGPTGTGKTHRVLTKWPDIYQVKPGRDPWGKYKSEPRIVFDEFDYSKWTIQEMNSYLDKWPCPLPARYFDKTAYWSLVVLISNLDPSTWWPLEASQELRMSFFRRIGLREGGNAVTVEILCQTQDVNLDTLALSPSADPVLSVDAPATSDAATRTSATSSAPAALPLDSNGSPLLPFGLDE
jgi:hypothetical protein